MLWVTCSVFVTLVPVTVTVIVASGDTFGVFNAGKVTVKLPPLTPLIVVAEELLNVAAPPVEIIVALHGADEVTVMLCVLPPPLGILETVEGFSVSVCAS